MLGLISSFFFVIFCTHRLKDVAKLEIAETAMTLTRSARLFNEIKHTAKCQARQFLSLLYHRDSHLPAVVIELHCLCFIYI